MSVRKDDVASDITIDKITKTFVTIFSVIFFLENYETFIDYYFLGKCFLESL